MNSREIVLYNEVGLLPFKKYLLEYLEKDQVKLVNMPAIIKTTLKEYESNNNRAFFYDLGEFGSRYQEFESKKIVLKETVNKDVYDVEIKNYDQDKNKQMAKNFSFGPTKKY